MRFRIQTDGEKFRVKYRAWYTLWMWNELEQYFDTDTEAFDYATAWRKGEDEWRTI